MLLTLICQTVYIAQSKGSDTLCYRNINREASVSFIALVINFFYYVSVTKKIPTL